MRQNIKTIGRDPEKEYWNRCLSCRSEMDVVEETSQGVVFECKYCSADPIIVRAKVDEKAYVDHDKRQELIDQLQLDDELLEQIEEQDRPYTDEEIMHTLYGEYRLPATKIQHIVEIHQSTVLRWIDKLDSVQKRPYGRKYANAVSYWTNHEGYESWKENDNHVGVHRLLAVAEFGFNTVAGNHVHHKNGIPWDNRPENIEVLTRGEHSAKHKIKIEGIDRIRVAELYHNGDASTYDLGELFDVAPTTVRSIYREFYPYDDQFSAEAQGSNDRATGLDNMKWDTGAMQEVI